MRRFLYAPPLATLVFLLGGCNSYHLRYQAVPQPSGANLFADYTQLQNAIGVSIDTDGRRLEDLFIRKSDGTDVHPLGITYAGTEHSSAIGSGVGVGTGNVAFGTGLAFPVGTERTYGLTTATFDQSAIGPAPWQLHVKVQGAPEAVFPNFGGTPTAK